MAHDTHASAHHDHGHATGETKSKTALFSSFWFVLILVGLFVAALNFIKVMSSDSHGDAEHATAPAHNTTGAHQSTQGNTGHETQATQAADAASHNDERTQAEGRDEEVKVKGHGDAVHH